MNEKPLKSFRTTEERNRFIDDLQQLMMDAKEDNLNNTLVLVLQSANVQEPNKVNGRLYRSFQNNTKQEMAIQSAFLNLAQYLPVNREDNTIRGPEHVDITPPIHCPKCGSMIILQAGG